MIARVAALAAVADLESTIPEQGQDAKAGEAECRGFGDTCGRYADVVEKGPLAPLRTWLPHMHGVGHCCVARGAASADRLLHSV